MIIIVILVTMIVMLMVIPITSKILNKPEIIFAIMIFQFPNATLLLCFCLLINTLVDALACGCVRFSVFYF